MPKKKFCHDFCGKVMAKKKFGHGKFFFSLKKVQCCPSFSEKSLFSSENRRKIRKNVVK
jgi:hypothetical protein